MSLSFQYAEFYYFYNLVVLLKCLRLGSSVSDFDTMIVPSLHSSTSTGLFALFPRCL